MYFLVLGLNSFKSALTMHQPNPASLVWASDIVLALSAETCFVLLLIWITTCQIFVVG